MSHNWGKIQLNGIQAIWSAFKLASHNKHCICWVNHNILLSETNETILGWLISR